MCLQMLLLILLKKAEYTKSMEQRISKILNELNTKGNNRFLRDIYYSGEKIIYNERHLTNLSSNDYLGIASDNKLQTDFLLAASENEHLFSSASSRLLTGNNFAYKALEEEIANLYCKEACVVFNSGYHANIGILPAITSKDDLVIADKLVHASIIDGMKLCSCKTERYRHLDYDHLESIIIKQRDKHNEIIVVTESVFSMDGDLANIGALIDLKNKYGIKLYIDEAHAFGVFGTNGLGLTEQTNSIENFDFIIGTFGKAAASQGAFLVCSDIIKRYLINSSRSLIFTTALPPINILWTSFVIKQIIKMNAQRKELLEKSNLFAGDIGVIGSASQIVPYIVGSNNKSIELSEYIYNAGFLCLPVRYPTVPEGTARLRFSLTVKTEKKEFSEIKQLISLWKQNGS